MVGNSSSGSERRPVARIVHTVALLFLAAAAALLLVSCGSSEEHNDNDVMPSTCPEPNLWVIDSLVVWSPDDGPILLDRNVFVTRDGTLEVMPGTEVVYLSESVCYETPGGPVWTEPFIEVEGRFRCEGTEEDPIVFSSEDPYGPHEIIITPRYGFFYSRIEWTMIGHITWWGGDVDISHSAVPSLSAWDCSYLDIEGCRLGPTEIYGGGRGRVRGNVFVGALSAEDDSLLIEGNSFVSIDNPDWGAVCLSNESRALVTENLFENCEAAIGIYSGSPTIHRNNFIHNDCNILVIAEPLPLETDTIDATENWWNTTDVEDILGYIRYQKRFGYYSGKNVNVRPYATEPFDLPTPQVPQWEGSTRHRPHLLRSDAVRFGP